MLCKVALQLKKAKRRCAEKTGTRSSPARRDNAIEAASGNLEAALDGVDCFDLIEPLTSSQFDLVVKTVTAVRSSRHPAQLEMKILANHRQNERFRFLSSGHSLWQRLRQGDQIVWADFDPQRSREKSNTLLRNGQPPLEMLCAYDTDDSNEFDGPEGTG